MKIALFIVSILLSLSSASGPASAETGPLKRLAEPGPWPGVHRLITFEGRIWMANADPFNNSNSADIYSFDPASGRLAYRRHLFSQDAGRPWVQKGRLYWPFEDSRFSAGEAEFLVTDGQDWRWDAIQAGKAFHLHGLASCGGVLHGAASDWAATLFRQDPTTGHWRELYRYPTPKGRVSRFTEILPFGEACILAMTARRLPGPKLFRWDGHDMAPFAGWPAGLSSHHVTRHRGALYAVNRTAEGDRLYRIDGRSDSAGVTPQLLPGSGRIQNLESDGTALWALTTEEGGGSLWRREAGGGWQRIQQFPDERPLDLLIVGDAPFVGSYREGGRGALWGIPGALVETPLAQAFTENRPQDFPDFDKSLANLDRALEDPNVLEAHAETLRLALRPLGKSDDPAVGQALSQRISQAIPPGASTTFAEIPITRPEMSRWFLLRALGLNGNGRVPLFLLADAWTADANTPGKHFAPLPAALWTLSWLGQKDRATVDALLARLARQADPLWLTGDVVGALSALTGQRFGYDKAAWRAWWDRGPADLDLVSIPGGAFTMGDAEGKPDEAPKSVTVAPFRIMRREVTNADFAAFVAASGHMTDAERQGSGYLWDPRWRRHAGADWRHPHGPASDIEALSDHPVVQVSQRDAAAFCRHYGLRLPSEAEWEFAARGKDGRRFPWGDAPPESKSGERRANFGTVTCCAPDAGDGYLRTAPAGSFPSGRSPFDLEDMAGNVWEWTASPFPGREGFVSLRGGGWGNNPHCLRGAYRHANPPDIGLEMVGFRCAGPPDP